MKLPEKVTTYGGPKDNFIRIVDVIRSEKNEEGTLDIFIDRQVLLKSPAQFITLNLRVESDAPRPQQNGDED